MNDSEAYYNSLSCYFYKGRQLTNREVYGYAEVRRHGENMLCRWKKVTHVMINGELRPVPAYCSKTYKYDLKRLYPQWLNTLTVGSSVYCAYDGKYGRCMLGKVIGIWDSKYGGRRILVRFPRWAGDGEITSRWFVDGGSWDSHKRSTMSRFFGLKGDFYKLYSIDDPDAN